MLENALACTMFGIVKKKHLSSPGSVTIMASHVSLYGYGKSLHSLCPLLSLKIVSHSLHSLKHVSNSRSAGSSGISHSPPIIDISRRDPRSSTPQSWKRTRKCIRPTLFTKIHIIFKNSYYLQKLILFTNFILFTYFAHKTHINYKHSYYLNFSYNLHF